MRIRPRNIWATIGIVMVLAGSLNLAFTSLTMEESLLDLCSADNTARAPNAFLTYLPINYIAIALGVANYSRDYLDRLVEKRFKVRDLKRLFLGAVVAGGSVHFNDKKYCVRYYGKDAVMHSVFRNLSYMIYYVRPSTVEVRSRRSYVTQLYSKEAVRDLLELSPEFGSRSGGAPSISFILEGKADAQVEAARIIMSTSGWLTCTFSRRLNGMAVYPRLGLGSVTPLALNAQYKDLMDGIGVKMNAAQDKRYTNSGYLHTCSLQAIETFRERGGFVEGTLVKRGAFSGIEKNELMSAICSVTRRVECGKDELLSLLKEYSSSAEESLQMYMNRIMLG